MNSALGLHVPCQAATAKVASPCSFRRPCHAPARGTLDMSALPHRERLADAGRLAGR